MARELRLAMAGEITVGECDRRLHQYATIDDPLMEYIHTSMFDFFYEEVNGDFAELNKPGWDFWQRLLLALESDSEFEEVTIYRWSLRQTVAAATLFFLLLCLLSMEWDSTFAVCYVGCGAISMLLAYWPRTPVPKRPYYDIIVPFVSLSDLVSAKRKSKFQKMKFPRLARAAVRDPLALPNIGFAMSHLVWLMFSPIVLLLQIFPECETDVRVTSREKPATN